MEKIDEPSVEGTWECPRCHQHNCADCVDKHVVDFHIIDAPEGYNQLDVDWEDELVCPWCYNQLIDKYTQNIPKTEEKT